MEGWFGARETWMVDVGISGAAEVLVLSPVLMLGLGLRLDGRSVLDAASVLGAADPAS